MANDCSSPCRDEFHALWDPLANSAFRAKMDATWDIVWSLTRNELETDEPITIRLASGQYLEDVMWTTFAIPIIVNDRVVNLLRSRNFSGWSTYRVVVHGEDGDVMPGYHGLAITGRCESVDWSHSKVVMREYPAGFFPVWRGPGVCDWDGSDLFMSNNGSTGNKFVTGRVRAAFEGALITNVAFRPISELETDAKPSD